VAEANDGTPDPINFLVELNTGTASAMSRLNLSSQITGTRVVSHADLFAMASSGSSEVLAEAVADANSGTGLTHIAIYLYLRPAVPHGWRRWGQATHHFSSMTCWVVE
jgi:hypothetical protein